MPTLVNLRYFRNRAGLSQIELAEKAGLARGTISQLENGRSAHSINQRKIAKALHCRPGQLIDANPERFLEKPRKTKRRRKTPAKAL